MVTFASDERPWTSENQAKSMVAFFLFVTMEKSHGAECLAVQQLSSKFFYSHDTASLVILQSATVVA